MNDRYLNKQTLYGSWLRQFAQELITNSGVFWIFDMLRQSTRHSMPVYFASLPHWILLGASIIQALVICRDSQRRYGWHHFIAPVIYTVIDMLLEGISGFMSEPYHILYWIWVSAMAVTYVLQNNARWLAVMLKSLLLVLLLPANYMISEWDVAASDFVGYWVDDSAHLFILVGALMLGVLLGTANIIREHLESLLYALAGHFEQIASWSFDDQLIQRAYTDDTALALHVIERTVLFMDIRGFTPWAETHSAQQVVEVINQFYCTAEPIVKAHNGFKIQMTGDEIMTRFQTADQAVQAAQALQPAIDHKLSAYGLSFGIGVHTGELIEGLVGGEYTRQYGVFGDTVNIAARLQAQAQSGSIVLSRATWEKLSHPPGQLLPEARQLALKGKTVPISVLILPAGVTKPVRPREG
jgi:adenylate cyclase